MNRLWGGHIMYTIQLLKIILQKFLTCVLKQVALNYIQFCCEGRGGVHRTFFWVYNSYKILKSFKKKFKNLFYKLVFIDIERCSQYIEAIEIDKIVL